MAPVTINQNTRELGQVEDPEHETDYILVECSPLGSEELAQLESRGAKVLRREGNDNTFLCRYTEPVVDGLYCLLSLPFVKEAKAYHSYFVLSPDVVERLTHNDIQGNEEIELSVYLHSCKESGEDVFKLIQRDIDHQAVLVHSGDTFASIRTKSNFDNAKAIAKIDSVRAVDFTPREVAQTFIAMQSMTQPLSQPWATQNDPRLGRPPRAFWGDGEVIAIGDTGFADGSPNGHPAFTGRVVGVTWGGWLIIPGLPVDEDGHGTAVAGCALGDYIVPLLPGAPTPAHEQRCRQIAGTAPRANLFSVRITDQHNVFAPNNRERLYRMEYAPGRTPKIWNVSFGSSVIRPYTPSAEQCDAAASLDLEQVIVEPAGNDGRTTPSSPLNNPVRRQITGPAAAKNVITVGATANMRWQPLHTQHFALSTNPSVIFNSARVGEDSRAVDGWADADLPIDRVTRVRKTFAQCAINNNSIAHIASCSSKGPTQEGRIKPDLVAPGTGMLTARSSESPIAMATDGPPEMGTQPCPFGQFMFEGGSSMSAPIVAGLVAALRQALREVSNNPSPSSAMIKALLINGAKDIGGTAYNPLRTQFDWFHPNPDHPEQGTWVTTRMPPAPNVAQGFGLPDLDRSLVHLTPNGGMSEHILSTNNPGTANAINLPAAPPAGNLMLRLTLVWTDPPGALMINKLRLTLNYAAAIDAPPVVQTPDLVQQMWWEANDVDRPVAEQYPNVQRITLHNPYNFTGHSFNVAVAPGTTISPFNYNGTDVRLDQPVSVAWAVYTQGT